MQVSSVPARPSLAPFDSLAETYDEVFTRTVVGRAQREAVWREMDRSFSVGQRILEINCGTGVDAIHLAKRGVKVVACDASPEMIRIARWQAEEVGVQRQVEFMVLKTENIFMLDKNFHFDGLLSNFGGLNCSWDISNIALDLATLLKPRAKALFCVFSPFCVWETSWYLLHGKPSKAFRRLRAVANARLGEGATVQVYRHSVRSLELAFNPYFHLRHWRGVGVTVPPSYLDGLANQFPRSINLARKIDRLISGWPLFRTIADHTLTVFERSDICLP